MTGQSQSIVVSGLSIYPVKSLRGVAVDVIRMRDGRPVGDREYVVLDLHGEFMDLRTYPQMARVEASITDDGLRLRSDGFRDLTVRAPARTGDVSEVSLWRRSVPVRATSAAADRWLSEVLDVPCRLMAFAPDVAVSNPPFYEVSSSLQDATAFHLASEESLADLNARAGTALPMNRFRANLIVRGARPYAEDAWKTVAVGDTVLKWIKACTRCVATTTDQVTGERTSREPLATLSKYRRQGLSVVFGHYLMAERWGDELRVGDPLRIVESQA